MTENPKKIEFPIENKTLDKFNILSLINHEIYLHAEL
jgi:hypothetical protein